MMQKLPFFIFFTTFSNFGYSIPIKELQEIKPDYKVIKYTYFRDENNTDVMDQQPPDFQIIPLDFLCEFCQVVILKLKERQATEPDFEQTVRSECLNSTETDSSSLCDVINRVNLERLKNGDPADICRQQNMCNEEKLAKTENNGPPGSIPDVEFASAQDSDSSKTGTRLTIDEKDVNTTLHVEDPNPYN